MTRCFYLDTNVYRNLVDQNDVAGIALLRRHRSRIRLTPVTVMELIEDLVTCKPENFSTRRRAIEAARNGTGGHPLPSHGEFLAERVFHVQFGNENLKPRLIQRWLDVAVRYQSQAQLGMPVRMGAFRARLDAAYIAQQLLAIRASYVARLNRYVDAMRKQAGVTGPSARGGPMAGKYAQKIGEYFRSGLWRQAYIQKKADAVGASNLSTEQLDRLYPLLQPPCEFVATILRQALVRRIPLRRESRRFG